MSMYIIHVIYVLGGIYILPAKEKQSDMHALASLLGRAVVAGYLLSDPCQSKPDNEHIVLK